MLAIGALVLVLARCEIAGKSVSIVTVRALLGLLVATLLAVLAAARPALDQVTFNGSFIVHGFARFMKIGDAIGSGVALAMSVEHLRPEGAPLRYRILILLSTLCIRC